MSGKTTEPLGILPVKSRRNPIVRILINYSLSGLSIEQGNLIHLIVSYM